MLIGTMAAMQYEPEDTIANVTNTIRFQCSSDQMISWVYASDESSLTQKRVLHNGKRFSIDVDRRYSIENVTKGQMDLIIDNVQYSDAGIYICAKYGTSSPKYSQLIVLSKLFHVFLDNFQE